MKICYFADAPSIHVVRWCKHFASLGHEVHLISFKQNEIENVTTHYINTGNINVKGGNWKVLLKFREIKKILEQIKPDIFHSMYATSYGITGALCGFHPYAITTLGTDVLISPKESILYKTLLKFAFYRADWITAMADHMKTAIIELGVNSDKISTVPFGIDPLVFNDKNRILSSNKFVITSTRNFEPVYNIPHLIKAISIAKKSVPNIHLNLIGAGSLQSEILQLIKKLDLEPNVSFIGKVPQPKIAEVLNQSHVFVSVSKSDGNNISLNEAMACGTACIATNIPANSQWIKDGINGFLVEIDDVETLGEKIIYLNRNYHVFQNKAIPLNHEIIANRAIWSTNMNAVEQKYYSLISKK
jgi:glycosyltransferase involved in cell wall biosynthesis